MLVIVNPNAGGGTGLETWRRIEPAVRAILGDFEAVFPDGEAATRAVIGARLDAGETRFVAAGGDGTVNLVATALVAAGAGGDTRQVCLGAIGLGSSNDFHKPFDPCHRVLGVPFRLDFEHAVPSDVGTVAYVDEDRRPGRRIWLVNASIGTTAEANGFFNRPDRVLRVLKRRSTGAAIAYAAIREILRHRARTLSMSLDGEPPARRQVENLGVVKNPHFSGCLRYDSPHEPGSGRFYVHTLAATSLPRLVIALAGLARGRFSGRRGASSQPAHRLRVRADAPFALEGDGEVVFVTDASFGLLPRRLRLCA